MNIKSLLVAAILSFAALFSISQAKADSIFGWNPTPGADVSFDSPFGGFEVGADLPAIPRWHRGTPLNPQAVASYIREGAEARGMNVHMALFVARTEGLTVYVGDHGTSFGPYQLHFAHSGHRMGLGDRFRAETGLDPRNPSTWRQQVDFSLDYAKVHGWKADWYGWQYATGHMHEHWHHFAHWHHHHHWYAMFHAHGHHHHHYASSV